MALTVTGTISSPYETDEDQLISEIVPDSVDILPPPPPASPTPTVRSSCPVQTEERVVRLADAVASAKIAFLVGATSGLLLAYFLRSFKGGGGECCSE